MPVGPETTPIVIACDESGFDGETLIGGSTEVFAHASVRLDVETAATTMDEVRRRTQTVARELKAGTILRSGHRPTLFWLIGPEGPLGHDDAHVHLTDKRLHLTGKMIDILASSSEASAPPLGVRRDALTLHRGGPQVLGCAAWTRLLLAFNTVSRASRHLPIWASVATFTGQVDRLRAAATDSEVRALLDAIRAGIPSTEEELQLITDKSRLINILDPMFPALQRTIAHWSRNGQPVAVVHDEQSSLTEGRIAQVRALSYEERGEHDHRHSGGLTDFERVDSRLDPRVQVADLLAGVSRSIASTDTTAPDTRSLAELLRSVVDRHSIWPDDRWSADRKSSVSGR